MPYSKTLSPLGAFTATVRQNPVLFSLCLYSTQHLFYELESLFTFLYVSELSCSSLGARVFLASDAEDSHAVHSLSVLIDSDHCFIFHLHIKT